MRIEKHCEDKVIIVYDFLSPEECKRLSTWLKEYPWDKVPVNQVKFWKQRLIHLSTSLSFPDLKGSFDPVKDITDTLPGRLQEALSLADKPAKWLMHPLGYIKMFPGSNPNEDAKNGMEMFYHIDNQLHMSTPIVWGSVFYTNDDYEGGAISYPDYDFEFKPVAGALVFHEGYTMHGVKAVTSGERYCITSLITEEGRWNPAPLPSPTPGGAGDPYIYPMGYWGKRMNDDPEREDVKKPRPDGTTAPYEANPDLKVKLWNIKYKNRSM